MDCNQISEVSTPESIDSRLNWITDALPLVNALDTTGSKAPLSSLERFARLYNNNIPPVNINVVGGYIVRLDLQEKILDCINDC